MRVQCNSLNRLEMFPHPLSFVKGEATPTVQLTIRQGYDMRG